MDKQIVQLDYFINHGEKICNVFKGIIIKLYLEISKKIDNNGS